MVRYNFRLRAGSQVAQQQTLRTYARALSGSFIVKNRGRPVFKVRKRTRLSLEYTSRGFTITDGRLVLAKGVSIPVVWSRELPSEPTSVRISQDSLGHWYASFVVRRAAQHADPTQGGIGIDWGVSTTATTTDPSLDLPYPGTAGAAPRSWPRRNARWPGDGAVRAARSRADTAGPHGWRRGCTRKRPGKPGTTRGYGPKMSSTAMA